MITSAHFGRNDKVDMYIQIITTIIVLFLISRVGTRFKKKEINFKEGDLYISTNQNGIRYLLETLEAEATDSFFNWNFFDTILQQKEGYSGYVFEDLAEKFLAENPLVKKAFEEKLKTDKKFVESPRMQLNFIYKNSPYYEKAHLRLPIFKVF